MGCHPVVAHHSFNIRPFAALPERWYLVTIATDTACLCAKVDADDGVARVAEVLVRKRPRPMVPGGAVVGAVMLWSVW